MKIFLFISIFCLPLIHHAQKISNVNKGNYIIGGSIGFSNQYLEYDAYGYDYWTGLYETYHFEGRQNQLKIVPSGMYFICNRLALGLGINYAKTWSSTVKYALPNKTIQIESGPLFRLYFFKNSGIYLTASYYTGKIFIKEYDVLAEDGYYGINVNISHLNFGLGNSFFLNKNLSFDMQINYSAEIVNSKVELVSDDFLEQFHLSLGFKAYINKSDEKNE